MLRSSISPTMIQGGYRVNVIPSEARATLDVRLLPDEDPALFLDAVRKAVNDPAVKVAYAARDIRPGAPSARLDSEAFKVLQSVAQRHYDTIVLPTMSTGATDMAYLRARGVQCYGIGPATDVEDGPKGFGAHSDQERILETELHRFVRFRLGCREGAGRDQVTMGSRVLVGAPISYRGFRRVSKANRFCVSNSYRPAARFGLNRRFQLSSDTALGIRTKSSTPLGGLSYRRGCESGGLDHE